MQSTLNEQRKTGDFRSTVPLRSKKVSKSLKWLDQNLQTLTSGSYTGTGNFSSITNSGVCYNLAAMGDGAAQGQRVGNLIRIEEIDIFVYFEAGTENLLFSGDLNNVIRLSIVQLRQAVDLGSIGNLTPLLAGSGATPLVVCQWIPESVKKVHFDELITVQTQFGPNSTGSGTATQTQYQSALKIKIKLNDCIIRFLGPNYSDNKAGDQLVLFAVSDSSLTPHPSAEGTVRVWYRDFE